MHRTNKAMGNHSQSSTNQLIQWLRQRPAAAVVLLLGVVVVLVAGVSLVSQAGWTSSGPLQKEGNPFLERRMPGGPMRPVPGGGKPVKPG